MAHFILPLLCAAACFTGQDGSASRLIRPYAVIHSSPLHLTERFLPLFLAVYIAQSAARMPSFRAVLHAWLSCESSATPILTVILNVTESHVIEVVSTSLRIFSARNMAASAVVEDASIVNSSPPKRAQISEDLTCFCKMELTICRATSPA